MVGKVLKPLMVVALVVGCVHYLTTRRVDQGDTPATCADTDNGIAFVTYNVGLAPGVVDYSTPRLQSVVEGIAETDFDVLCVQEAWEASDKRAIVDTLVTKHGGRLRSFSVETAGEGETGTDVCTASQISAIESCVREHCEGEHPEQASLCAVDHCKTSGILLYLTARKCLNCLVATAGHDMDDVHRICVDEGGASRIYHGQNGNILISRHPMRNMESIRLRASGANRVALLATIDVRGQEMEVACTHLSSKTYVSPTHPAFTRWEDEQRAQLEEISSRLDARAGDRPRMLVGDLNIGRRNGNMLGDHMRSVWDTAMTLGYISPADRVEKPFCTSCADNALRHKDTNYLIDHVMVNGDAGSLPFEPLCAERLLDDVVTVPGYDGAPLSTRRSDHYALRVVFGPAQPPPP